jgi:hypothetical protein
VRVLPGGAQVMIYLLVALVLIVLALGTGQFFGIDSD